MGHSHSPRSTTAPTLRRWRLGYTLPPTMSYRPLKRNTAMLRRFKAVLAFDSSEAAAFEQILKVSKYLVPGFRV